MLTIADFEKIGFTLVPRKDGKTEVRNRSVSFVLSPSHGPNGKKNGLNHWAGYKDDYFVAGWNADSIPNVINTLINEERYLAFHEGRQSIQRELQILLGIEK